jgi:aminocarboxymuconate-semialdehyde decarboxylase
VRTIDFHTHIVPGQYPARPAGIDEPAWPIMEKIDDQHSRMMIAGKQFRVFESFYWNPQERVRRLDEEGIDLQVISPLPELLSYWLNADAAVAITDFMNQFVSDMVSAVPARFRGMGSVALQDPQRAGRQLEGFGKLGLKGVHVGSHVNGKSIADPAFYPFLEAAAALDLAVFVHGIKPGTPERMLGSPLMPAVIGVPTENTMVISSFIMTDILKRFPTLRLVFSHGGGTIGAVIDRFTATWKAFDVMRTTLSTPTPDEYVRRFWYDSVVFGGDYLALLIKKFGANRIIGGTDGPVNFGQPSVPELVRSAGLSATDTELIAYRNCETVLGIQ